MRGRVAVVRDVLQGSDLEVDAVAGATTISVTTPEEFDWDAGGSVVIAGQTVAYVVDAATGDLLLADPLAADAESGTAVTITPTIVERWATVIAEDQEEEVSARVPHSLWDKLDIGIRDREVGETVDFDHDETGDVVVKDVIGKEPLIDGSYLDPTKPVVLDSPPSDGAAPGASPAATAQGGIGYISVRWLAVVNADPVIYEVHMSTTPSFTPDETTMVAETGGTIVFVDQEPGGDPIAPGTTYHFQIVARDQDGAADPGAEASAEPTTITVTTDGDPPASSPVATIDSGFGILVARWAPVSNADTVTYEVHVSAADGFTPDGTTKLGETLATSMVIRKTGAGVGLVSGVTYYVRIVAKDADGSASPGAQSSGSLTLFPAADITGQITGTQISDGAVDTPQLHAGAVTAEKILARTITALEIAVGTITADEIAAGAITTDELDALAVTAEKIAALAIEADKIASGAITTDKLDAGAVTAEKILARTITGEELAATLLLASTIQTAASGARVVLSNGDADVDGGIFVYDGSGVVAAFPIDTDYSEGRMPMLKGRIDAQGGIDSTGAVLMRSSANEVQPGGAILLAAQQGDPSVAPTLSVTHDALATFAAGLNAGSGRFTYVAAGGAGGDTPSVYGARIIGGTSILVERWNAATGAWGEATAAVGPAGGVVPYIAILGITQWDDGTTKRLYVLARIQTGPNYGAMLLVINQATGAVTATVNVAGLMPAGGAPATVGKGPFGPVMVHHETAADGNLVFRGIMPSTGVPGAVGGTSSGKTFEYDIGQLLGYEWDGSASWVGASVGFVPLAHKLNSSWAYQANNDFILTGDTLTWDGTRFLSGWMKQVPEVNKHDGFINQGKLWVAYTWADGSGHETMASSQASIDMTSYRGRVTVSSPALPSGTTKTKWYVGNASSGPVARTSLKYHAPTTYVTAETPNAELNSWNTGAPGAPPATNGFAASASAPASVEPKGTSMKVTTGPRMRGDGEFRLPIGTVSQRDSLTNAGDVMLVDDVATNKLLGVQARYEGRWNALMPSGSVIPWAGDTATPPPGWLAADGSAVSRTTYAELFAVIGTTYGAGNGSTTFNLPDMKGRIPVGPDASAGRVTANNTRGASSGTESHKHSVSLTTGTPSINGTYQAGGGSAARFDHTHTVSGNTGSASNMMPYLVVPYIIKT